MINDEQNALKYLGQPDVFISFFTYHSHNCMEPECCR